MQHPLGTGSQAQAPSGSLLWAALAAHLQQLLGKVPAILQAVQVAYEFLAAHALPNVLWHGEKWGQLAGQEEMPGQPVWNLLQFPTVFPGPS